MKDYKAHEFKGDNFEYQNEYWEKHYASFIKER